MTTQDTSRASAPVTPFYLNWRIIVPVVLAAGALFYYFQKTNSFIRQENGVVASYDANKAVLDKVTNTIKGAGLATDKYADLVIKAITAAMSGRYGEGGSKAAMQWIQEQSVQIDPATMVKLQQVVEANFEEFKVAQITLRDRTRIYRNDFETAPGRWVASFGGYPRQGFDIKLYERMIVTTDTSEAFTTGRMRDVNEMLGGQKK